MLSEILELISRSFVFYFVVIDPLGTVAIFLTLIPRIKDNKYKIAFESTILAFFSFSFLFYYGKINFKSFKYIFIFF